jgi:Protein of unknown function (DUF2589)
MSYATSILTRLPFGNIIGGPMKAAIEAQAIAARATVDFIREVGFSPAATDANGDDLDAIDHSDPLFRKSGEDDLERISPEADFGEIRNVTFSYTSQSEIAPATGSTAPPRVVSLTVPLLTIVPIPYLRIDEMTIDFMVKITEEIRNKQTTSADTTFNAGVNGGHSSWWSPVKVDFNTSLSTKHSSTGTSSSRYSTEATMNVHVRAVQDAMPAGLAKVLSILEASIKEKPKPVTSSNGNGGNNGGGV